MNAYILLHDVRANFLLFENVDVQQLVSYLSEVVVGWLG
jgi:hypothetical protein